MRPYKTITLKLELFRVDTRYIDLKPLGKGAYGTVCAAQDNVSGERVAIKKVADMFADLVTAKRMLREIRVNKHFVISTILSLIRCDPVWFWFKLDPICTQLLNHPVGHPNTVTQPPFIPLNHLAS